MRLFDTHAHLCDDRFDSDREKLLDALPNSGIELVLECATSPDDWEAVAAVARRDYVYAAYGVHPHNASGVRPGYIDDLERALNDPKCVAVGEIGLDYHYDFSPRDAQMRVLREQLDVACARGLPVVLHDREAHADMLSALSHYKGKLRGVMHCYSGSAEMLRDIADLGLYVAFGGSLTFPNAKKTREAALKAPLEYLLIETDCPYLTPRPLRGKRNDPSNVKYVCEELARLRGVDPEEMADITLKNGKTCFGL